ncbi:MAG: ribulose-phosphate 3-epimerase [Lactobacillus sp.]|nr:ribulose-phosphate 3-epimerase [Lactobacillus sp.]
MIAPSILNAPSLTLGQSLSEMKAAGIKRIHVDIMDGHFVPNLSFGPELVANMVKQFDFEIEIHLMSTALESMVPAFLDAGADLVLIHYEAGSESEVKKAIKACHDAGKKAGLVLNPATPISVVDDFPALDQVLLMSVVPGFGGQAFIEATLDKIASLHSKYPDLPIEVDGGVKDNNIRACFDHGASIAVVGSFLFKDELAKQVKKLEQQLA